MKMQGPANTFNEEKVHTITEGKKSFSRGTECFGNSLLLHAPQELSGKHGSHERDTPKNSALENATPTTVSALNMMKVMIMTIERGGERVVFEISLMNANII